MAVDSDGPALFRAQLGLFEEEWREDLGRVWFDAYGATPRHTSRAAGVAAESAAAG